MDLPQPVVDALGRDADWSRDHDGQGGDVWRVHGEAGTFFVKRGSDAEREHPRLRWLADRLAVPELVMFTGVGEQAWLVLADVGAPSVANGTPVRPGVAMGSALRALHLLPVDDCPFDAPAAAAIEQARRNLADGLVDPDDFDDDHAGTPPEQLLERVVALTPPETDLVVGHGDATAENVLVRADGETVLIDPGGLGVADRHRDLALACRSLADEHGEAEVAAFFSAYHLITNPDPARIYWYRLLDELL